MSLAYQLPEDVFKYIAKNAGIILDSFDTSSWTVSRSAIKGATQGGINFSDVPTFTDFGEDIDNCPKNMKELKELDSREVKVSGTYVSIKAEEIANVIATADVSEDGAKITPRNELKDTDFKEMWFVCDYGKGGAIAIRLDNVLSTSGYALQTADKGKGTTAFEYTSHYSMDDPSKVPYEIFIKPGTSVIGE